MRILKTLVLVVVLTQTRTGEARTITLTVLTDSSECSDEKVRQAVENAIGFASTVYSNNLGIKFVVAKTDCWNPSENQGTIDAPKELERLEGMPRETDIVVAFSSKKLMWNNISAAQRKTCNKRLAGYSKILGNHLIVSLRGPINFTRVHQHVKSTLVHELGHTFGGIDETGSCGSSSKKKNVWFGFDQQNHKLVESNKNRKF